MYLCALWSTFGTVGMYLYGNSQFVATPTQKPETCSLMSVMISCHLYVCL